MPEILKNTGSFRDPSGYIYQQNDDIFRIITSRGLDTYNFLKAAPTIKKLIKQGDVVDFTELDRPQWPQIGDIDVQKIIQHPTIPFITYPYEWPFFVLKQAALLHLDIQIKCLKENISLSDATAYNVQFNGTKPAFIDLLSFRPYQDGEFWTAHRQFCEQFLNPLLMRALLGVPHNSWYRGNLEGIPVDQLSQILPLKYCFSWKVLSNIILQAKFQNQAYSMSKNELQTQVNKRKLPKSGYLAMLSQLRDWIASLTPKHSKKSTWGDYDQEHTYNSKEEQEKIKYIKDFCAKIKPKHLWDLGCNSGQYSEAALSGGAENVVGFDFDQNALDKAWHRAIDKKLNFLPLFLDATNPSPAQGWNNTERQSLQKRGNADAIIALAFEHHLAIGKNIPLPDVIAWLTSLAPSGVIEFVPKNDSTIQKMLAIREDIFSGYTQENFEAELKKHAQIIDHKTVSAEGRTLYWFERSAGMAS